jgi:hypothetical protein
MPLFDLVVADETEADAVGSAHAPTKIFPGIAAKDIDHVKLAKLALILDGVPLDTPAVIDVVRSFAPLHESSEDGPWVHRVPDRLVAALVSLDERRRGDVARAWAGVEEFERDGWDGAAVAFFLDSLCGLAGEARARDKGLFL